MDNKNAFTTSAGCVELIKFSVYSFLAIRREMLWRYFYYHIPLLIIGIIAFNHHASLESESKNPLRSRSSPKGRDIQYSESEWG